MKTPSNKIYRAWAAIVMIPALFFLNACNPEKKPYEPTYSNETPSKDVLIFGVPGQPCYDLTTPFINYLNDRLTTAQIKTVASFSLEEYMHRLDSGYFDFTIVNGPKALYAEDHGYNIEGKCMNDQDYTGVIFVNKDSSIEQVSDLKGKTIASPGEQALAGHMMPYLFLLKNGISDIKDLNFIYSNSFESAIMNVYLGKCAAGFTWSAGWKTFMKNRPEINSRVELKWLTPPLVNNAVLFREDMEKGTLRELKNLLFSMHETKEGREALRAINFTGFEPADSMTYNPVKDFLKEYYNRVRINK